MKKVTGTLAIYNDMGFLASIAEVTPGEDDSNRFLPTTKLPIVGYKRADPTKRSDWLNSEDVRSQIKMKPGSRVYIAQKEDPSELKSPYTDEEREAYGLSSWFDDDIKLERNVFIPSKSAITGNEGWQHAKDRPNFTPFTLTWDEWDRELLRNSRARIKKMFKTHYFAAQDKPGDKSDKPNGPKIKLNNLKARLFPAPGAGLLPWWKRRKLKRNVTNANGEMCDGPDILG
jgi:hypothetical protein